MCRTVLQTTPIVVDGVLYFTTSRSEVYALDGASGRILWHYKYEPPVGSVISRAHKGVAVANGKVFVGTFDSPRSSRWTRKQVRSSGMSRQRTLQLCGWASLLRR
jgi:outer membrane protein assembly factor BamB